MDWNLEGRIVRGKYAGLVQVRGTVLESRVAYGGRVKHHVELIEPVEVYGAKRYSVLVNHEEVENVE